MLLNYSNLVNFQTTGLLILIDSQPSYIDEIIFKQDGVKNT